MVVSQVTENSILPLIAPTLTSTTFMNMLGIIVNLKM